MIYLLCKEKWQGKGRMTDTDTDADTIDNFENAETTGTNVRD